jgi:hypothetical protein
MSFALRGMEASVAWVALRQCRLELIIGLALLAALTALLVPTGMQKLALFRDSGLAACLNAGSEDCTDLARGFLQSYAPLDTIINAIVVFAPTNIGVLLAAPTVLDFEQRTYRLAWTQGVTRNHWLAVKLGIALLGAAFFAGAFTLLFTWWLSPQANLRDPYDRLFTLRGVAPVAYIVFSLALALAVGTLTRRMVPAMIATIIGFFVALHLVGDSVRPSYIAPVEQTIAISVSPEDFDDSLPDRAWIVGGNMIDRAGRPVTTTQINEMCSDAKDDIVQCLEGNGVRHRVLFHPADRFWAFQAIEAAIFLGAAAVPFGLTVWVVRARMR